MARPRFLLPDLVARKQQTPATPRRFDRLSAVPGNKSRFVIAIMLFIGVYAVIGARLVTWGTVPNERITAFRAADQIMASRPDLVDRNGQVLATDIKVASLFAEPKKIVDANEASELLLSVLPDLEPKWLYDNLSSDAGFLWLRRELTPSQQQAILDLGVPGIGFRTEKKRFYPGGPTAGFVTGHVNVDNQGIAGMEKYLDDQGYLALQNSGLAIDAEMEPVALSIDLRVQHILRDELAAAMTRYRSIAAGGVVLDVKTGEVIAMTSLPDYDPNDPKQALEKDRMNRTSAGLFEMGSTFKAFTSAMALDSGEANLQSRFDASKPIYIGGHRISDFHGKHRVLTLEEVFIYSSNIGSAKEAEIVGIQGHQDFLTRMGLLTKLPTELPEVATPTQPKEWKQVNSITISYGHGVSTTPLQTAVAAAALVNGGVWIPPTFMPRGEDDAMVLAKQVVSPKTSADMRHLFRLNVEDQRGSGNYAEIDGYGVGGKTGTANKVENGRYSNTKKFNAFLSAFPMDDPRYVVLVFIDEPKPEPGKYYATAGMNAAPTVGNVIRRAAALLKVKPDLGPTGETLLVSY
ncbi:probable penicillin-binding transmembrane protein [Fulvimarina pelagi HTCC2506]|uniref:Probable penicillin-binding transmembrane protein n=1 Tax=Fulvimarina pelagi HTCC2506 TaxID=314231 RepID=Q0G681_9HYPH|nr:penicillin-binding protein 2 [Fulvimarina pelagi]EAU42833.1 probable penicillin-binding transmembrane protein [Fulvimarina pelagi HTCC2506]